MVKLIGAAMTGLACAYPGFRMRMTLKTRVKSLSGICASLEALEGEIGFAKNKLEDAFVRIDRNGIFTLAAENIGVMGAKKAWRMAVEETADRLCLTEADCDALKMLGDNIGRTDADDQIKSIRYIKGLIVAQREQADREYQSRAKLYSAGGMLIGAMIVIVLL